MNVANVMRLVFRPLTADRWDDFESLFGKSGAYGGCWCMYWRITRKEFEQNHGAGNRRAMKDLVGNGVVPGLLAYAGDRAVAWCAIAPRSGLGTLNRSRVLKSIDDEPVWSITCFFIARDYRSIGVTEQLIAAAVEYAGNQGARLIEAYPHAPTDARQAPVTAYMGFPSTFERLGFHVCRKASKARWIMRCAVDEAC